MDSGLRATFRAPEPAAEPVTGAGAFSRSLLAALLILLLLALAVPAFRIVWTTWTGDYRFGHGPVVLAGAFYLLGRTRASLRARDGRTAPGRWLLAGSIALTAGWVWLDMPTLLPLAWLGLLLGTLGYLHGTAALRAAAPAFGLLLFTLPWPTPLLRGITSAAQEVTLLLSPLLAPLAGMHLEREGTLLTTAFAGGAAPYSVIVGAGCAGMKYLFALASLAYFAAVVRRLPWQHVLAGIGAAVPLALLANSLRILLILGFGAAYGPRAGEWAHQNLGLAAFVLPCAVLALVTRRRA